MALLLGFSQISVVRIVYVIAYHVIMAIVELFRCLKNCCGNGFHIFKRKRKRNQILLAQEKRKKRFHLLKRRQQLIGILGHKNLSKDDHFSTASDNNGPTDLSIDKPEFEYVN